jgi:hypothetical protein
MMRTVGNLRAMTSVLPSDEALSTTTTSGAVSLVSIVSMHCGRSSRQLKFTTTTAT